MMFDTDGLTLIEWYISELPKFIEKHKGDPKYHDEVIQAQSKLNLLSELGFMRDGKPTISRPSD